MKRKSDELADEEVEKSPRLKRQKCKTSSPVLVNSDRALLTVSQPQLERRETSRAAFGKIYLPKTF